jgi:hypothetical protein
MKISLSGLSKKEEWVNFLVNPGGLKMEHLKNGTPNFIKCRERTNISLKKIIK